MRHLGTCTLTLAGALLLAACAEDKNGAPAVPTSVSQSQAAGSCSFSTIRQDATAYFASSTDPVFGLISTMESGFTAGGSTGATSPGFNVLARVASAVRSGTGSSPINGTPAAGNKLVTDLLSCMSVGAVPSGFSVEAALGPNGLFEVPHGSGALTSRSTPTYGAEPQADWNASAGGKRYLLYGYPIANFSPETPAGLAFELSTVPAHLGFSPAIKAGVCTASGVNPRLQHNNAILALEALSFCATAGLNRVDDSGMFGAARRAVRSLLLPQPLYAAMFLGGIGGQLDNLSPSVPVTFLASDVRLTWVQEPVNTSVSNSTQFQKPVAVKLSTVKGTALAQIPVSLTVIGNKGSFVATGTSAVTDLNGIATFHELHLDKPGGYTIRATAQVLGTTITLESDLFHINGQ